MNIVLAVLVLAAAGFAGASIVGGGLAAILDTTSTATGSTSTETSTTPGSRRVVICHVTHSKKHPSHTITVSQRAVAAHLRHGDSLGACVAGATPNGKHHGHDDATTTGTSKPEHDAGHGHGAGHGKGHS